MQKLVLFDIDGVIFNPQKLGASVRRRMIDILNVSEDELIRTNADYYANLETTTDFNPHEIVSFISEKYGADRKPLDELFWGSNDIYKEGLYDDAEDAIKRLSKDHTLGIFSQGFPDYQMRKLEAAGIKSYFSDDNIFIENRKLSDEAIELLPRDSTVIDNNHEVIVRLKPFADVIWINRMSDESDPEVKTIHSLSELS